MKEIKIKLQLLIDNGIKNNYYAEEINNMIIIKDYIEMIELNGYCKDCHNDCVCKDCLNLYV